MKALALILLACLAFFVAPRAEATTTCTITSITNIAFSAVDPSATGTDVPVSGTVNYSCTYNGPILGILYSSLVTLCISIGPDDLGNIDPRTMIDPLGDRMRYQLYKDANRTSIWGVVNNATFAPASTTLQVPLLSNGATINGSMTIYGKVPAGQSSLSPGSYTGTLAGGTTGNAITWSYNEVLLSLGFFPATCTSGGSAAASTAAGPSITVTASVAPKCTLATATDLNFGSVSGLLKTRTDQTSLIRVTCTNRAAYQVGLDNGKNASGTIRRMAGGGRFVTYELYRDTARTLRWGNTLNTDTQTGSGNGSEQTLTVFGRVPVQAAAVAGDYSDIVTILVTY